MNDVTRLLDAHRSIRKFQDRTIEETLLEEVLRAGTRASTSGNMQFYSIVATRDAELKTKLYEAHRHQEMVLRAPVVLTFCADQHRLTEWMSSEGADYAGDNWIGYLRGVIDVSLVAQNVAVAAESHGLGICYMGSTLMASDKIAQILKLPKLVFPVTSLVIGWPDESPARVERLPLEAVVHRERYEARSSEKIKSFYVDREAEAWDRLKNNSAIKARVDAGEIKNTAQIYTNLKYSRTSLETYSETVERALKDLSWLTRVKSGR
jgi:nitroreductase